MAKGEKQLVRMQRMRAARKKRALGQNRSLMKLGKGKK